VIRRKNATVSHNTALTNLCVKLYYIFGPYVFLIRNSFLIKILEKIMYTIIQLLLYNSY
jgi:hypothetical protein